MTVGLFRSRMLQLTRCPGVEVDFSKQLAVFQVGKGQAVCTWSFMGGLALALARRCTLFRTYLLAVPLPLAHSSHLAHGRGSLAGAPA
jgi:hypothetical protein